jgi:hypothetical protein
MMKSVSRFILEHPIAPPNVRVTALNGEITAAITAIEAAATNQLDGSGEASGGVAARRDIYRDLRDYAKDVCRVARSLDATAHPGIAEQFVLPRSKAYTVFIAFVQAMIGNATPLEAELIAHGLPATFLADLNALITAFESGTNAKLDGQQTQVGGTSGLLYRASLGLEACIKLDAIIRAHFRNDPVMLDIWTHARHIQAAPQPEEPGTIPPPSPGEGTGTTAAVTTGPTGAEGGAIA